MIFVKLNSSITTSYIVNPSDTIGSIKDLIYKDALINPHYQRLTYNNDSEDLEDNKTLSDYNIQDNSTLRLFDNVTKLIEFLKTCIPKTTNVNQFLALTKALTRLNKMVKESPFFFDLETLFEIFEILNMFIQFQNPILNNLPDFIKVKLMEFYESTFEMLLEFFKIITGEKRKEIEAEIEAKKT